MKKVGADLAAAKQFNGGQACISPDYVFIKEQQKSALVAEFQAKVRQNLYREDGSIKKESIAQIINAQNFSRIKRLFDDAVARGAKIAVGGTTWVEQPLYSQVMFAFHQVGVMAAQDPKLKDVEPLEQMLSEDRAAIAKLPR